MLADRFKIQDSARLFWILNPKWIWQGRRDLNPLLWIERPVTRPFVFVLKMRVKRFELLHKLGLSQSPLPLGYTRKPILAFRFAILDWCVNLNGFSFKKLSENPKSEIQNQSGGSEGIQTLTRSLQDFYAVNYITNPRIWYRRWDLNSHHLVSKTSASCRWATSVWKLVRVAGFEPANTCSQGKPV